MPLLEAVHPAEDVPLPANGHIFFKIVGPGVDAASAMFVQGAVEEIVEARLLSCANGCIFDAALPGSIGPGPVEVVPASDLSADARFSYLVVEGADNEAPSIEPPLLSVEERRLPWPTYQLLRYIVEIREDDGLDDFGVGAVIFEAGQVDDPEEADFVHTSAHLGPPANEIDRTTANEDRTSICARLIAFDLGGNRAESEEACAVLKEPPLTVDLPLGCTYSLGGGFPVACPGACSCTEVQSAAPVKVLSALLLGLIAGTALRRRRTDRGDTAPRA